MSDAGWGIIFVISITLIIALVVYIVVWQLFKTSQARQMSAAEVARQEDYLSLARKATAAQEQTAEELAKTSIALTDLQARVGELERILKEVA